MLTLYVAKGTIGVAVSLLIEELAARHKLQVVDFGAQEQRSEEYLALNPKGRVPALVAQGEVLTETGAILEYLAETHGRAFLPGDPLTRARMRELMFYLASTMHVAHAHKMRGARWADRAESWADMTAKVPETMAACCAHLEETLAFAPFAVGPGPSVADCYLYAAVRWVEDDGVPLADYPRLAAWFAMMDAREAVRRLRQKGDVL